MTTSTPVMSRESMLPLGAVKVRARGLLSSVVRPCPEHGGECLCVARRPEAGCLVYWCAGGAHHFSAR